MRFALYVPNFHTFGHVPTVVALARAAEAAGWDGFFLWDHLLPDADAYGEPVADPWIALAAIASATTRIRLGALVTPLPRRRPWKLARETATLDQLSQGRLVVGAGIGGDWWREYSAVGEPADARQHGTMLDEGLAVLTGLWSGQPFSYRGAHYTVDAARFLPPPAQVPRPPIWVAGVWPGTRPFRRAAQWDGIVPTGRTGPLSPADISAMLAYIAAHRTATTPFDVVYSGRTHEQPRAEAAATVAAFAAAGVTWWLESFWAEATADEVHAVIAQGPPELRADTEGAAPR